MHIFTYAQERLNLFTTRLLHTTGVNTTSWARRLDQATSSPSSPPPPLLDHMHAWEASLHLCPHGRVLTCLARPAYGHLMCHGVRQRNDGASTMPCRPLVARYQQLGCEWSCQPVTQYRSSGLLGADYARDCYCGGLTVVFCALSVSHFACPPRTPTLRATAVRHPRHSTLQPGHGATMVSSQGQIARCRTMRCVVHCVASVPSEHDLCPYPVKIVRRGAVVMKERLLESCVLPLRQNTRPAD